MHIRPRYSADAIPAGQVRSPCCQAALPKQAGSGRTGAAFGFTYAQAPSYVDALGYENSEDAIGKTVTIQITDALYQAHTIDAEVVGMSEAGLVSTIGRGIIPTTALADTPYETQNTGLPAGQADKCAQASIWFARDATDA